MAVSSWVCHCQACFCLKCLAQLSNLQVWFVGVSVCQCVGWHNVSSELPEAGAEGTCRRQVLLYDLKNTGTAFKGSTKSIAASVGGVNASRHQQNVRRYMCNAVSRVIQQRSCQIMAV